MRAPRDIFIAVCYFPPTTSPYAIHSLVDGDPFSNLHECILKFSSLGDIIILGDFNAWTRDLQTPQHNRVSNSICTMESNPTSMGFQRHSSDKLGPLSCYGRHLLQFCEFSNPLIVNNLSCFLGSESFTCWWHKCGRLCSCTCFCYPFHH